MDEIGIEIQKEVTTESLSSECMLKLGFRSPRLSRS